ncbi:cytochrome P450 [Gymnopilus junonius]|uniref:Cytochrome P450 n=1 Tax=Gymnopilus junonius TaxID=109634 RepID=A0A9P5NS32_GYMJU|nr:cytochrome P450 [Gymnopilus junonius]
MGSSSLSWIAASDYFLAGVLFFSLYVIYKTFSRSWTNYPPGPPGLPFVGNVLQIPSEDQTKAFTDWGAQYGDIIYIRAFSQSMVILNSLQAARDLLEKRSSIYSDRPRFVLLSELMGWEHASTHQRYGPGFRKHRRFINQAFNNQAVTAFRPLQKKAALVLVEDILESPENVVEHFRRYAAGTILKITYGHEITSADDPLIQLAERAGTLTVEAGSTAANLVDFFPLMRHIPTWAPFSTFKIKAMETRKAVEALMEVPFEQVKSDMKSGSAVPSYTSMLLQQHSAPDGSISPEDEDAIRGTAGTLLVAAEDTTLGSIHTLLLALVLNPHELRKAQKEIDLIIGQDRLPNIDDRPSLPYLECVLKEALRMNPTVPLGFPHRLTEDDIYRDFYIPAGATVFSNIYGILHDCDNPSVFRPQRYLEDTSLPDPLGVIFGFGRRICPGRYLAETNYWIMAATIIAAFEISKAVDEKGNDLNKSYEFASGFIRHPKPFKCSIKPRLPNLADILNRAKTG